MDGNSQLSVRYETVKFEVNWLDNTLKRGTVSCPRASRQGLAATLASQGVQGWQGEMPQAAGEVRAEV